MHFKGDRSACFFWTLLSFVLPISSCLENAYTRRQSSIFWYEMRTQDQEDFLFKNFNVFLNTFLKALQNGKISLNSKNHFSSQKTGTTLLNNFITYVFKHFSKCFTEELSHSFPEIMHFSNILHIQLLQISLLCVYFRNIFISFLFYLHALKYYSKQIIEELLYLFPEITLLSKDLAHGTQDNCH